jgi:cytochrome c biogenesis protein CcmG/thiol:disulfide interchange protein DsbE
MSSRQKTILGILLVAALVAGAYWYGHRSAPETTPASAAAPGSRAPEFRIKDLEGREVALSDLEGKVVLVNFWATWCKPCALEIPWLIELQKKYGEKGFTVVGIAMDDEGTEVVAPYVREHNINYPVWIGNEDVATKFGGILGIPTSFLVSKDGLIVQRYLGILLASEDQVKEQITKML